MTAPCICGIGPLGHAMGTPQPEPAQTATERLAPMDDLDTSFISELLKHVMARFGLKQADLAELFGVSLSRVKAMTSGRVKNLTREESGVLIKKLHIRGDWLATGEGPMFQSEGEHELHRRLDIERQTPDEMTPDQIKEKFRMRGLTISQWARDNGYKPTKVIRVLNGFDKGHYGQAHEIAVKLGLKPAPEGVH